MMLLCFGYMFRKHHVTVSGIRFENIALSRFGIRFKNAVLEDVSTTLLLWEYVLETLCCRVLFYVLSTLCHCLWEYVL